MNNPDENGLVWCGSFDELINAPVGFPWRIAGKLTAVDVRANEDTSPNSMLVECLGVTLTFADWTTGYVVVKTTDAALYGALKRMRGEQVVMLGHVDDRSGEIIGRSIRLNHPGSVPIPLVTGGT